MVYKPMDDLKWFAVSRPPIIVFVICLSLFGIVLMSVAFYVNDKELKDPDVTRDWNVFLGNFADIDFCIVDGDQNETLSTTAPFKTSTSGKDSATTLETEQVLKNYSLSMLTTVNPTREFLNIPHNVTFLTGAIPASYVGIKGAIGSELINVTMHLPYEWNNTKCHKTGCEAVQIYACVYFQAAESVFPESKSPGACEFINDTGIEYHAKMMSQAPKTVFTPYYCRSRPLVKVHYILNPHLTMWLSIEDHSAINMHLMHTSYFLFVMVIMILLFALFKGRSLSTAYATADKLTSSTLASSASI